MSTVLLIIDIQNDYFPGGKMELSNSVEAGIKAKALLEHFRAFKLPVVHIQHFSTYPGATFFIPETDGVKIADCVTPLPDEKVIAKNFPNSFRNTELSEYLKSINADKLIICGMMTHMCIDATTRAAFDFGYNCTVINDAAATRSLVFNGVTVPAEHVHYSFLAALGSVYAKVISADEYINSKE